MSSRSLLSRLSFPALIAALVLVAASVVLISADNRVRLDAGALARSRGGNQGNVLMQFSCNYNNGNSACSFELQDCVTCTVNTFTGVSPGFNGGYNNNGTASCGDNWSGTCNAALACITTRGNKVGVCNSPTAVAVQ